MTAKPVQIADSDKLPPSPFPGEGFITIPDNTVVYHESFGHKRWRDVAALEAENELRFNQGQNAALRIVGDLLGITIPTHTAVKAELTRLRAIEKAAEEMRPAIRKGGSDTRLRETARAYDAAKQAEQGKGGTSQ